MTDHFADIARHERAIAASRDAIRAELRAYLATTGISMRELARLSGANEGCEANLARLLRDPLWWDHATAERPYRYIRLTFLPPPSHTEG